MLEGNPSLLLQACNPAASSQRRAAPSRPQLQPPPPPPPPPPPVTREGAAQPPSPPRMPAQSAPSCPAQHRSHTKRLPHAPSQLPGPDPPALPCTAQARAEQQASQPGRRPREEPGGERAAGETSRVPGGSARSGGAAAYRARRPARTLPGWPERLRPSPLKSRPWQLRLGGHVHAWPGNRSPRPARLAARRPGSRRPRGCGKP